jgi:hypothetical protein
MLPATKTVHAHLLTILPYHTTHKKTQKTTGTWQRDHVPLVPLPGFDGGGDSGGGGGSGGRSYDGDSGYWWWQG